MSGGVVYLDDSSTNVFGSYPNYLWDMTADDKGLSPPEIDETPTSANVVFEEWAGRSCYPASITIGGGNDEKPGSWEIQNKIAYSQVQSVFRKGGDYIWTVKVGRVLTTTDELYG